MPGTYVKNGVERIANTTREAVALVFEGYKFAGAVAPTVAPVEDPAPVKLSEVPNKIEDDK